MRLVHWSAQQLTLADIKDAEQVTPSFDHLDNPYKPKGLWVSDEDGYGWKEWCEAEGFQLERLAYGHEIELHDSAKLLTISTDAQLDVLTETYGIDLLKGIPIAGKSIDWQTLAKDYDGIVISPYLHSRRFARHTLWYYGWDCASGCIWNKAAIKSLKLIKKEVSREV